MSLTIFLALCILGLDFMIYVLFKLFYGDRRSLIARRVAEQRKSAPPSSEPRQSAGSRTPSGRSRRPFASSAFHAPFTSGRHQLR